MRKFKKIYVEITNFCNLACDFCPRTAREPQFMSVDDFSAVLNKIKGHSDYIYLHVMGEPLLHPQLGEILDKCAAAKVKVNLTTNGSLIGSADYLLSKPALRQVNFSLHSGTDTGPVFDFIDRARFTKLLFCLRLWNLEAGAEGVNSVMLEIIKNHFHCDADLKNAPTHVRGVKVAENVFLNQAEKFEWPSLTSPVIEGKAFCYGLRDQLGILVDGTVVPCCLDADGVINLGNIKNQELEDIINSKRAKAIYDGFSRKEAVEELCKKCSYRIRFKNKAVKGGV